MHCVYKANAGGPRSPCGCRGGGRPAPRAWPCCSRKSAVAPSHAARCCGRSGRLRASSHSSASPATCVGAMPPPAAAARSCAVAAAVTLTAAARPPPLPHTTMSRPDPAKAYTGCLHLRQGWQQESATRQHPRGACRRLHAPRRTTQQPHPAAWQHRARLAQRDQRLEQPRLLIARGDVLGRRRGRGGPPGRAAIAAPLLVQQLLGQRQHERARRRARQPCGTLRRGRTRQG